MIKKIKITSLVLTALVFYTFFGGMTVAALNGGGPGVLPRCHAEGEKPAYFCAVVTGVVKLMKCLPNGNQQIVGLLLPGDSF